MVRRAGRPPPELNCAPGSQSLGCWSERGKHTPCLSYSPQLVPWAPCALQLPLCPRPYHLTQRSWCLWALCGSPVTLWPCRGFRLFSPLVLASLRSYFLLHWCRNGNMSGTRLTTGERRLCRFPPEGRRCRPDSSHADGTFQQSLGVCYRKE